MYKSKIEFTENFDGERDVRYQVAFDDSTDNREISFREIDDQVRFPLERLEWLIECLIDIKNNIHENGELLK